MYREFFSEKEKYIAAWKEGTENNSRCAIPIANYIKKLSKNWKILDIGCGNGIVVNILRNNGFDVRGMDITLEGLKLNHPIKYYSCREEIGKLNNVNGFFECPVWNTSFKDNEFDLTISTDMLEHIPLDLVEKSIQEIYRITKQMTFHCIANFEDNRGGFHFHRTVKPIEWWVSMFESQNNKKVILELWDRKEFLKNYE